MQMTTKHTQLRRWNIGKRPSRQFIGRLLTRIFFVVLLVGTAAAIPNPRLSSSNTLPTLHVVSVASNNSSVKIRYLPVQGAKDYRVFDVTNPNRVKYAGMVHLSGFHTNDTTLYHFLLQADGITPRFPYQLGVDGPYMLNVPQTEIEWNSLPDNQEHTLIVQAVDALGPVPPANLYNNDTNLPLVTPLPMHAMLGGNTGPTLDGKNSINGQGPSTNNPRVIAQSDPITVRANPSFTPFMASNDALMTFLDTFENSEGASFVQTSRDDAQSTMSYSLNAGTPKAWDIYYQFADTIDSMPFIADNHFMDMLFDGGTPGTNSPLHQGHGVMAMTPRQTADLSGGKMLHATMEVDLALTGRRWVGFQFAPANDPLIGFDEFDRINSSQTALFLQLFGGKLDGNSGQPTPAVCTADLFNGPSSTSSREPNDLRFWGGAGQTMDKYCDITNHFGGSGIGLDNRVRLDVFMTKSYMALFEDGVLVQQGAIPAGGLPFSQVKVYYVHYVYHTDNDIVDVATSFPWYTYWATFFKRSDERHWDNMGFQVLPASAVPADWSTLAARIQMPRTHFVAPQFTNLSNILRSMRVTGW